MYVTCWMQCEGVFIFEPQYIDRNVNQMWLHAKKEIQSNNNKTEHDRWFHAIITACEKLNGLCIGNHDVASPLSITSW